MRRVRCPACSAIIQATSDVVTCGQCGLTGRVDPLPTTHSKAETKANAKAKAKGKAKADARAKAAAKRAPRVASPRPARDPWQITIDLRSLNPGRWSAGARSFAVFLLIAGAFFAGGFSGIAFERAKSGVLADLDDGLFGSGDQTVDSGGATGPGGGDPPDATDPGSTGEGSGDTPAGDPVPPPQQSPTTIRHEFTHEDVDPSVTLEGGLVRVYIQFNDPDTHSQFRIKFLQDGEVVRSLTASSSGPVNTLRYLEVPAGTYDLKVGLSTDQSTWAVRIEEPRGEVGTHSGGTFSERGDSGVGPMKVSGDVDVAFTASQKAAGTVSIKVFLPDGTRLESCGVSYGNTAPGDAYSGSWKCDVGSAKQVYFDIAHPHDKEGTWTLRIT